MTQSVTKVIVTDGGPLELATSILALAYGFDMTASTAASLKATLGLGDVKAHNIETAFSYPNGVGLVVEGGRTAIYLFDSDQEELKVGAAIRRLDLPEGAVPADILPADGTATQTLPTATPGDPRLPAGVDELPPQMPGYTPAAAPLTPGEPMADAPAVSLPDPGSAGNVAGTSDVADVPGITSPVADPADTAGGPGAGDQTAPALAESEAAASGRNPEDGLIDPNAETLEPVTGAGDLPAEASGDQTVSAEGTSLDPKSQGHEAYTAGLARDSNPFTDGFDRDAWNTGFDEAEENAKPLPGGADQSGFHSAEG